MMSRADWRAKLKAAWKSSPRRDLVRLVWSEFPGVTVLIAIWGIASGALPNLVVVVMGRVVGLVPLVVRHGWASGDGHMLTRWLVVFGASFAALLALSPIQLGMTTMMRMRLTSSLQRRLMDAVCGPASIAHLEDPSTLDRVATAQGSLMSYYPADAPISLAAVIGVRLQGILACCVLGWCRWWLGVAFFLFWTIVKRPLNLVQVRQARLFSEGASVMRRANYDNALATKPDAAQEVRIYGLGHWLVERLRESWLAARKESWDSHAQLFRTSSFIAGPLLLLYLGTCAYLAHAAYLGKISIPTVAVSIAVLPLTIYVGQLTPVTAALQYQMTALPTLRGLETELGQVSLDLPGSTEPPRDLTAMHFEHVAFSYPGASTEVFSDLDLVIAGGRSTAIVGLNGVGKTTLVKLLTRLYPPTSGRITLGDVDIAEYDPVLWQRRFSVVFQDFTRYPLSAYANVAFGAIEHADDRQGVEDAAREAGALDVVEGLPKGWETIVSKDFAGGIDLSGGQWQCIVLARALFAVRQGTAPVLIMDEPTAWLDVRGEAAFYDQFLTLTHGVTSIVISHRFSTVRLADRIVVLDAGGVVEEGSHDELLERDGHYASMYRLQAEQFASADGEAGS